jgi:predicted transcriptional regulator
MRSSLLTILLSSEKRTDLLLLLKEKPRTIEEINTELDTNSVAILPQLKKLKEYELVFQEDRVYTLSLLGKIIARKVESLVKSFRLLEDNYDYWSGLKPGEIPPGFFKWMEEFAAYNPGRYHGDDTSSVYQEMKESFSSSKKILLIISSLNSCYPGICTEHARKGSEVSVLLTQPAFEKFTTEFKKDLETLILFENSRVYVLENNIVPPMVAVTDTMVLTCFSCGTSLNGSNNLISFGNEAVKWGLEIFEFFRALAKPLVPELINPGDTKSES